MEDLLKIRLAKSPNGRIPKQRCVLEALGLRKTNKIIYLPDSSRMWGMINKISHLVVIERVKEKDAK